MMRTLVTGITGFVGGHLTEALLARQDGAVLGLSRSARWPTMWQHLADRVELVPCDLADADTVEGVLRRFQPDRIFHLAGYAHVGRSFQDVEGVWAGNLTATRRLYSAVERWGGRPRILFVSSGLVYGDPESAEQSFDERNELRPASPYAASKAAADLVSYQYSRVPGLPIIRVRPLNHIGPGQSPQYAVANFASQIAAIERGDRPTVIETGNLASRRDLTDVRDVVAGYLLLMERGRCGEAYNLGSTTVYSMQAVLEGLLALARVRVQIVTRPERMRPVDAPTVRLNTAKLCRETGWEPRYTLRQTLEDVLNYWRKSGDLCESA